MQTNWSFKNSALLSFLEHKTLPFFLFLSPFVVWKRKKGICIRTTQGWVNNDVILIFGWTIPLMTTKTLCAIGSSNLVSYPVTLSPGWRMSSTHTTCTLALLLAQDSTVLNGPSSALHVASASLEYRISSSTCSSTLVREPLLLRDLTLTKTLHVKRKITFYILCF